MKHWLKRLKNGIASLLAGSSTDYSDRVLAETAAFSDCENVHDLPEIFHYWSNRYLVPMQEPFGFSNPDDFFHLHLRKACGRSAGKAVRVVSIGAGNCDLEIKLAEKLHADGQQDFVIECMDLNADMLARGRSAASRNNVERFLQFTLLDFNRWKPERESCDAVMANQSVHHVLELEHLFKSVRLCLKPGGVFIISDMIGRNGHMRWPEALRWVRKFWQELPESYRFNRLMQRLELKYINHDCSTEGFEGIRAQDILPLLTRYFSFEFFLPFGNIIYPFIDRAFGHNFNAAAEWDRAFIDRVHAADEALILKGEITPTSMLAVLRVEPAEPVLRHPNLTPGRCIRRPMIFPGPLQRFLFRFTRPGQPS